MHARPDRTDRWHLRLHMPACREALSAHPLMPLATSAASFCKSPASPLVVCVRCWCCIVSCRVVSLRCAAPSAFAGCLIGVRYLWPRRAGHSRAWYPVPVSQDHRTRGMKKPLRSGWRRGISGGIRLLARPSLAGARPLGRADQVARRDLRRGLFHDTGRPVVYDRWRAVHTVSIKSHCWVAKRAACERVWILHGGQVPGRTSALPPSFSPLGGGGMAWNQLYRTQYVFRRATEVLDLGGVAVQDEGRARGDPRKCDFRWSTRPGLSLVPDCESPRLDSGAVHTETLLPRSIIIQQTEGSHGRERAKRQAGQSDMCATRSSDPPFRRGPMCDWRIGASPRGRPQSSSS